MVGKEKEIQKSKGDKGISVTKQGNFSEWYTEIVQKAELADLRYNVKGFLVFQPWSVLAMEKMYDSFHKVLQRKGHKPYFFPTVIPEGNLKKESSHIAGFTPEVFWITEAGSDKFNERLALRPTSETAFYQMFALWVRSYKDLPFKTYQRANVFRYETKATRPFLRSREFHWIETHCVHADRDGAMQQVKEDMETTQEVLHDIFGLPFIFFKRPDWDKFAGADSTFAADVLNPDGKVVQQPSTHIIAQSFAKAFDVKYKDKTGKEQYAWTTCYGPAISRIFASVAIVHGDDKGLRFPWRIAPTQAMIVPVTDDEKVLKKVADIKEKLSSIVAVDADLSEKSAGEKFNQWEMKGVPLRIDIGPKDMEKKQVTIFRRDTNKKEVVAEKDLVKFVEGFGAEYDKNIFREADSVFENRIKNVKSLAEMKKAVEAGGIARCAFCSDTMSGAACAEKVEKEVGATVRGTKLETEKATGECVVCGKKAGVIVYVARQY